MSGRDVRMNKAKTNNYGDVPILQYFTAVYFDTDIGTEELVPLEMVATIVQQLTRNLSMEEIVNSGFANYYEDHTLGIWSQAAGGVPPTAT